MGKLLRSIVSLAIGCAVIAAIGYWYVQPERPLDLTYSELKVRGKLADMIASRKLEVELTEPEVNSLLKKALAAHAQVTPDLEVTGAEFSLEGKEWVADVNLLYKGQWEAAARLYFTMSWQEPYLTAVHTSTKIKRLSVPLDWFRLQPLNVELNDYLPRPAGVRSVAFEEHAVRVGLKLR
ncbi:hypothetical protein N0M98_02115 [Paenibacillus doosanensis]|uniref:Deacetylase PdaC domain-containing protein n=1 Tax=Paenibacillus konkukensis TaxID=2020716 RepID=A0ABY4RYD2_9BACL|nr:MULTISPECIES: hypothetical protein [Paenibacillus]MCS7458924.1 hypothetical protein [Paenibacillus doosanensis]UQZ86548.1 hypothetical protein SK3146_05841 [Paenibacillus konkukensis]